MLSLSHDLKAAGVAMTGGGSGDDRGGSGGRFQIEGTSRMRIEIPISE